MSGDNTRGIFFVSDVLTQFQPAVTHSEVTQPHTYLQTAGPSPCHGSCTSHCPHARSMPAVCWAACSTSCSLSLTCLLHTHIRFCVQSTPRGVLGSMFDKLRGKGNSKIPESPVHMRDNQGNDQVCGCVYIMEKWHYVRDHSHACVGAIMLPLVCLQGV